MKLSFSALVAAAMAASVSANEITPSDHLVDHTEKVFYACSYESIWNAVDHPVDYPSNAHNSPPVLVSHNADYKMFTPGQPASAAVKSVAETGDPTLLIEELVAVGTPVMSYTVGSPMFFEATEAKRRRLLAKPGEQITGRTQDLPDKLIFTPEFTKFTSITMLAPSPDWFTSSHGFEPTLTSDAGMVWAKSFKLKTMPYDAGTDSGTTFLSEDSPTDPPAGIAAFEVGTSGTGIFESAAMDVVNPVSVWSCSIDSVMYKCEFDDECTDGKTDDEKEGESSAAKTMLGLAASSLMAGAYLFL